ncbi:hypothetical protein JXA34_02175 [Patescibacteria group bacterium]|nr:hypothetical protein [Patescibacteria group bacterium]
MHEIMRPKEYHSGLIFPTILVLFLMSATVFYLLVGNSSSRKNTMDTAKEAVDVTATPTPIAKGATGDETVGEFEELVDDEDTPEEVDSAVVEELDALLNYIENNVEKDSFSDLEL